jgi:hypothetical protein
LNPFVEGKTVGASDRRVVDRLEIVMERARVLNGRQVPLLGGFLLLGLLAVAVWLLTSASPASAQTDHASTAHGSMSTDPVDAQQPTPPIPRDSAAPPPVATQIRAPEVPPPVDLNALTPTLPSVTDALPPPLQPAVADGAGLLPAPARAPIAPLLSHATSPPPSVDVAPGASVQSDVTPPPGPSAGAPTTADAAPRWWPASHGHNASELRAADSASHEGDTRAPPSGLPPAAAAQGNVVSSSDGRDFGQSTLLFGVVAAGIIFLLGRGGRLWREATGWLPAPWCLLIERPG